MTQNQMAELKPGDAIVYDDGRKGHSGVKAVVLENGSNSIVVSFEDRADTTTIFHNDTGWTRYLTCAS